jgi:hypothetical protein
MNTCSICLPVFKRQQFEIHFPDKIEHHQLYFTQVLDREGRLIDLLKQIISVMDEHKENQDPLHLKRIWFVYLKNLNKGLGFITHQDIKMIKDQVESSYWPAGT